MALHELDADLRVAEQSLHHWERKYPELVKAEADAKVTFELAWADVIDEIAKREGKAPTIPVIEAEATKRCAVELKAKKMAEAELEVAKKLIGITETTLTSIQTRAGLFKIEAGLAR